MTESVASLKELAARAVLELEGVERIQQAMPQEVVEHLDQVWLHLNLDAFDLASVLYAQTYEWELIVHAMTASGQDLDAFTVAEMRARFDDLRVLQSKVTAGLKAALATVVEHEGHGDLRILAAQNLTAAQDHMVQLAELLNSKGEWLHAAAQGL